MVIFGVLVLLVAESSLIINALYKAELVFAQSSQQDFSNESETTLDNTSGASIYNSTNVLPTAFLTYNNSDVGIKIEYPNNWRVSTPGFEDYSQIVSFFSPLENLTDVFPARVIISQQSYVQNVTLGAYTNITLNQSQALGVNITESKPTKLSGQDAHQLVTTLGAGGNEFTATTPAPISKVMQVWTVQDNKVYILYYIADEPKYSAYLPIIQKMIDSFVISG
jgi:hypothetical protein